MNLLALLIIGMIFAFALFRPNSKMITVLLIAIFVLMITGTRDAYDYNQYCIMYSRAASGFKNVISGTWLLTKLMYIGSLIGFSYDEFRFVVTIIESIVILFTFKRYTKNTAFAWLLFILFPGWWLTTLFRHTIALTIIIWSVRYLIEENKYNLIKYIICVIAAGMFHSAFWFFLIFVLIKFFDEKKILIAGIISTIVLFTATQITIINNLLRLFRIEDDIAERIKGRTTTFSGVLFTILYLSPVLLSGLFVYWTDTGRVRFGKRDNVENTANDLPIYKNFFKICCTYPFLIAMNMISSVSSRLSHFYSFFFILICANCLEKYKKNIRGRLLLEVVFVLGSLLLTYITCLESEFLYERIIKAIFDTNVFLNF